jgi:hypothetical protein
MPTRLTEPGERSPKLSKIRDALGLLANEHYKSTDSGLSMPRESGLFCFWSVALFPKTQSRSSAVPFGAYLPKVSGDSDNYLGTQAHDASACRHPAEQPWNVQ